MKRWMGQNARVIRWGAAALLVVVMLVAWAPVSDWLTRNDPPQPLATSSPHISPLPTEEARQILAQGSVLAQGALLNQTLTYQACGHVVQRRVDAPAECIGMERAALEKLLSDYRVTAFSPSEVAMQRELSMYCPAHWVVRPDDLGELCIWQNQLGEHMDQLTQLGFGAEDLPESERETVRRGKAFDSQQDMEGWLESIQS